MPSKRKLRPKGDLATARALGITIPIPVAKRKPHVYNWSPSPQQMQQLEFLSGTGLNIAQLAHMLGVGPATFDRRRKEDATIDEAITRGRAKAIALVTNRLFQDAQEPGNLGAQCFYLKNQAGWRDRSTTELTGPDGGPIETQITSGNMSMEEKAARVASMLALATKRKIKRDEEE